MAMIKCPECKKEISDKAITCPNCGYGLNSTPVIATHKRSNAIPIFLLICFIVGGLICFYKANENNIHIRQYERLVESSDTLASITDPKWSDIIDTSNHYSYVADNMEYTLELNKLKKTKIIFSIITGACGLGACISTIIIVTNNKRNKQIESHN